MAPATTIATLDRATITANPEDKVINISAKRMQLNQIPIPNGLFLAKQYGDGLMDLIRYNLTPARSFAQHGEDNLMLDQLKPFLASGFYVDVGANHPSKLSNTFKLYKSGMRGIAIEPNPRMCRVYEKFRPQDVCLCMGLGSSDDLQCLKVSKYHGLSSFSSDGFLDTSGTQSSRYIPITTLNRVLDSVCLADRSQFALLSIDCEGWDEIVLQGNNWTKHRPLYIIAEFLSPESRSRMTAYLQDQGYALYKITGCNLLFRDEKAAA
jgi:FkbM family methyltransferase